MQNIISQLPLLKLGSKGEYVKKWQSFLLKEGYSLKVDGYFGPHTHNLTIEWQEKHKLEPDGKVGSITWGYVSSIPAQKFSQQLRTRTDISRWIKNNLSTYIKNAIVTTNTYNYITITEDWLGAIANRETGHLILKYVNRGKTFEEITRLMKGDFRKGIYNGYSYWQIDIGSFPEFIEDNLWLDPQKSANKAAEVLVEKASFLANKNWNKVLNVDLFERAVTSSYNCGQGNVDRALRTSKGVDYYTFNKDYSKEVFKMRQQYKVLE
jgi:hypothetical protein